MPFEASTAQDNDARKSVHISHRASGLVYARECVLFAGCKSLPEWATAP